MAEAIKLQRVHFPGYEVISDNFNISAAIIIPQNARLLVTSGHVGLKSDGNVEESLEKQIDTSFEVCGFYCLCGRNYTRMHLELTLRSTRMLRKPF